MNAKFIHLDKFMRQLYNWILFRQTHEDYRGLERAKEAMVDVANYINEMKRDSEHLDLIQKVRVSVLFHLNFADLLERILPSAFYYDIGHLTNGIMQFFLIFFY